MGEIILKGRYIIEKEIGQGGMAIVYKAKDEMLNRSVAIKVLRPEFKQDEDFIKRFDAEAKSAAALNHPNIVSIYDVGIHEGLHYIVMEYLEGETLKDLITRSGKLPWRKALKFASQICGALSQAHAKKVIHRDIKPHNIMVTNDGTLKVMDFGIARATSASTMTIGSKVLGSAHYLSPEQARGGFTDERSDLYSLGICLYEMVTGKVPFDAETTVAVAMQHLQSEAKKPSLLVEDLPDAVEYIILKAMQKKQEQRYSSSLSMNSDILRVLADPSVALSDDNNEGFYSTKQIDIIDDELIEKTEREKKAKKKKKAVLIGAVAALGVIVAGAILSLILLGGGKNVDVPNLKGLTLEEAEEKVLSLDEEIVVVVKKEDFSLTEERNKIIDQEPPFGRPLSGSKEIYVTIGLGEEEIKIESFVGDKAKEVAEELERLGLRCIIEDEKDDDLNEKYDEGRVTRQEPEAGEAVKNASIVTIYVSLGGENVDPQVPFVTGMKLSSARSQLNSKGYFNIELEYVESEEEKDTVVLQKPEGNERANEEDVITLYVAKGETNVSKDAYLTFRVPDGEESVNVKVIRKDNGDVVYKKNHSPGDEVSVKVKITGTVIYEIYINDAFKEEKSVQG